MPIYQYKCSECGAVVEKLRPAERMKDEVACPSCGGEAHHIISNTHWQRSPGWASRVDAPKPKG